MIKYQLNCEAGHAFESWFASSDAFDKLAANGAVACPVCGSTNVRKAIMAPNVSPKTRQRGLASERQGRSPEPPASRATESGPAAGPPSQVMNAQAAEAVAAFIDVVRKVRSELLANADDVGDKFAEEARKIHYDEAEARAIYGEATVEEARELVEEGIDFLPLPRLPEDRN